MMKMYDTVNVKDEGLEFANRPDFVHAKLTPVGRTAANRTVAELME